MSKKRIAILGSTGSIGTQTLQVVAEHPDLYEVRVLTAHSQADALIGQALRFEPDAVVIVDETQYNKVREALADSPVKVYCGAKALTEVVQLPSVDVVLTATVGFSGLEPTIAAIKAGKQIALANKETLVVAGELITDLAMKHRAAILPVDSEHSAIFQCLVGEGMINKGFEVIEAKWLFGIGAEKIEVLVHPQSIVHSAVQFCDGSVKAQLGLPDKRLPIQYALSYPQRLQLSGPRLDLLKVADLTFERPDLQRFPCLPLAYDAIRRGGNMPCILNAANEVANLAFRQDKITFPQISEVIATTMQTVSFEASPSLDTYRLTDSESRRVATEIISNSHYLPVNFPLTTH